MPAGARRRRWLDAKHESPARSAAQGDARISLRLNWTTLASHSGTGTGCKQLDRLHKIER